MGAAYAGEIGPDAFLLGQSGDDGLRVFPTRLRRRWRIPTGRFLPLWAMADSPMLMGELATCVKYKLPVRIVVIKNNSLGQIKWEQMVFLGNPEYVCDLQPIDFAGSRALWRRELRD